MQKPSASPISAACRPLAGLVLACALAGPLRADLDGRLGVLAGALAASNAAQGHAITLSCASGAADAQSDPLTATLVDGMRRALSETALSVLSPSAQPSDQDLVLDLSVRPMAGGLALTAALHGLSDTAVLWSRNAQIPAEDLPAGALAGAAPGGPDTDFNVIPAPSEQPCGRSFHWDLSAGYKAFVPWNSTFRSVVGGRLDGLSVGASFQDMILVDVDAWHSDLGGQGTLQSLDYAGVDVAVVAPLHMGPFTLYAGPGGRFGSIQLNDGALPSGSVAFGNNAFEGVAGLKASYDGVGLDLRYGYDFTASYTGYHTLRLGAYYAFGR